MKVQEMTDEIKSTIVEIYKKTYSVSEVIRELKTLSLVISRTRIVNVLKEFNIYEGFTGKNYSDAKVNNLKKIMLNKYGIENWGQLKSSGYVVKNTIKYRKISYLDEQYREYCKRVSLLTKKNIKKIKNTDYCYYTGILFSDAEGESNPNDPRKKSVDHKIPKIICYLNGISAEDASSVDNLAFVLKYVNTIKGNTDHENFMKIAPKIREVFINEGYTHKQID
jgi:hypothetical protein